MDTTFIEKIKSEVASFLPISLAEMDEVKLLNRTDTKFVFSADLLPPILSQIKNNYKILEINNTRVAEYNTLYYDTEDLKLFKLHQNGRTHRYKIRFRNYVNSILTFLEVKKKNNKGRTIKTRIKAKEIENTLSENSLEFLKKELEISDLTELKPMLSNHFHRLTLVNKTSPERVTVDIGVSFSYNEKQVFIEELIIAEVKKDKLNAASSFLDAMRLNHITPQGISKYCLGTILLKPYIKHNNFKEQLRLIEKIIHHELRPAC
ncbi:hypothetical protein FLAV_01243 [Flavobacteriales bacterium]|nr:hypothetical protein FLAV_01243 [Flavobacteriales bacterium]